MDIHTNYARLASKLYYEHEHDLPECPESDVIKYVIFS